MTADTWAPLSLVQMLEREMARMAGRQAVKILTGLKTRRQVEAKLAELVRKRHRRRKARLQQKASRRRNRS